MRPILVPMYSHDQLGIVTETQYHVPSSATYFQVQISEKNASLTLVITSILVLFIFSQIVCGNVRVAKDAITTCVTSISAS